MKLYRKACAWFICLLILILAVPGAVFADEAIDMNESGSITIYYEHKDEKIAHADFDLYRVADINAEGEIIPIEPFEKLNIGAYEKTGSAWKTLSAELDNYIQENRIVPVDAGSTNAEGVLSFPQKKQELKPGVFFVVGHDVYKADEETVVASLPFLISIPQQNKAGEWNYHVTAKPKADSHVEPGGETPPPDNPPNTSPELPYTGQLWWPVPILLVLGMGLVLTGMLFRKEE